MSEYTYYEFLAIDKPLTPEDMSYLRSLSTRAHITPVSFTNEYNWGDFKGDTLELMKRFFDAHVFVANWITGTFMLRLPIEAIPMETANSLASFGILDFLSTESHWIVRWELSESRKHNQFGWEDGPCWMARLSPVRDELLRGDMRALYIGWLSAVSMGAGDDDLEPLALAGLGELTTAQEALAEFMEIDQDLLAGAAMGSPAREDKAPMGKEMDEWLEDLPHDEARTLLKQLLVGQGQQAERALKRRFAASWRGLQEDANPAVQRRVGDLWKNAEKARMIRLEREKRAKEELEMKRRKARDSYLERLSKDFPGAWKAVQQKIERGTGTAYDEACRALVDLSEAYSIHLSQTSFGKELRVLMANYTRRKALIGRLLKANIWQED